MSTCTLATFQISMEAMVCWARAKGNRRSYNRTVCWELPSSESAREISSSSWLVLSCPCVKSQSVAFSERGWCDRLAASWQCVCVLSHPRMIRIKKLQPPSPQKVKPCSPVLCAECRSSFSLRSHPTAESSAVEAALRWNQRPNSFP